MIGRVLCSIGVIAAMTGCSSIFDGSTQTLTFNSDPAQATCTLTREGKTIGTVVTPGRIKVEKTKHNILVACSKEGFEDTTATLVSGTAGYTFGNIVLGAAMGGMGWAIDSISGADNKYDNVVNVFLKTDPRALQRKGPQG